MVAGPSDESAPMSDWLVGVAAFLTTLVGVGEEDVRCLHLGALDSARVLALTSSRPEALDAVYARPDAASEDRELLADYARRGLRLRGGALERLECRVVRDDDRTLVLDIVDRLGRTWVVDESGRRRELPRPAAERRTVTLVQSGDGWRVSASR